MLDLIYRCIDRLLSIRKIGLSPKLLSPRKRGSMFSPALVCVLAPNFYAKVPRGKGKIKFVFRYDRQRDVEVTVKNSVNRRLFTK